ncbi:MAG: MmgE/PrpD family protein [Burkholderiales bacterium]|nr:MmgE/PrpD family protein [Burkholderiales bacterium]
MDPDRIGASRRLAAHAASARYGDLPPATVAAFRRALLDFLACAISGSAMPVSRALLSFFEDTDASRTASVIGSRSRLSPSNAAMVNGASCHGLDFDDGYLQAAAHPAGAVFPAVLAAAEERRAGARDIVAAVVAGYDVMLRIGAALHPAIAHRGFHNTAVAGVFGAAAGVANLIGLDERQALHALGIAGSFAGGIRGYLDDGADTKRIHPGKAARDGLLCAEFARRGLTGPGRVLEGRYGLFHSHVDDDARCERMLERLGERWEIESVYFKPYPCCRGNQTFIDAIRVLHERKEYAVDEVARIDLGGYTHAIHGHDHRHHENLLDAQMSLPCAAALALVFGDVTVGMFRPEVLGRPDVRAMLERTNPYIDGECDRLYPHKRSALVRVVLHDGREREIRLQDPRGEPANPMTNEDLERKLVSNCEPVIGGERCARLIERVWAFETLAEPLDILVN